MAMPPPPDDQKAGAPEWMTTFADLMSLLLTFFVLLLSFSNMEIVKFRQMAGSMREAFGMKSPLDISNTPMGVQVMPMPSPSYTKTTEKVPSNLMTVKLREVLEKENMEKSGNIEVTERGVTLRLDGDAVFETGKVALKAGALKLLDRLAEIAATSPGQIEVEGHTDNVPMRSARYPSNWELSAARAGSAVRYLTGKGLPAQRLKAIGFGDTRPLVPNDSKENRAKNRRVEFLFVNGESTDEKPTEQPG